MPDGDVKAFDAQVKQDLGFTPEEISVLLENMDSMSEAEIVEIEKLVDELERRRLQAARQMDLIQFILHVDKDYKVGAHHRMLADMLMAMERGDKDRICVNIPPRHGKSQMVSIYFPAWFLGRNPGKKVMMVSHTTDLAVDFGRKVRNLIASDAYKDVFPTVTLAMDSKSAGRWNTNYGGEYFACGIGSALAGRGADLLLIDDPHSEQDVLNGNFSVFDKAYEWYAYGARTRLMPGGRVGIIQCMVGDTPVLMEDGTEKALRDVCPGDMVASYKDGDLVSRRVLNWANQGSDQVFNVVMDDGNVISGNARHPFLVVEGDKESWVRLGNLTPGMRIRAFGPSVVNLNTHVSYADSTTTGHGEGSMGKPSLPDQVIGGSSGAKRAPKQDALAQPALVGCAYSTTTNVFTQSSGLKAPIIMGSAPETHICVTDTVSGLMNTTNSSKHRVCVAPYVELTPLQQSAHGTGIATTPSPSTTAIRPGEFGVYYATHVTCSYETTGTPKPIGMLPRTLRTVKEITPNGREDVYDIEVEDTHNFIANGNVVSNTRWHMDDMTGRVIRDMTQNPGADQFEVVEFPAILDLTDKDGKPYQKALWPEFFDLPALERTKASMPVFQWNAQYQQNPTAEEGSVVKREWWQIWEGDTPPVCEYIIMSLDAAAETHNRADYTALTTWGVFLNEKTDTHNLILLKSIKERLEFPELKKLCMDEYKDWEPDAFIVEKKSAGTAVYQEMRRSGIPVQEYTPHRGTGDKMARLNSVADIISSGFCWVPAKRWAEELIEEVAGFPFMSNDDLVDSTVMALLRFRQGGFLRLPSDLEDDTPVDMTPVHYY